MHKRLRSPLPLAFMTLALTIPAVMSFSGCTTTTTESPDGGLPDPTPDAGESDAGNFDAGNSDAGMDAAAAPPGAEAFLASEILGRPTADSITLNVVPAEPLEAYVEWGKTSGSYDQQTTTASLVASEPFVVLLDKLAADTGYFYRLRFRRPGEATFVAGAEHRFHTQRPPGSTFRFTIQADSHMDENSVVETYQRTLANIDADAPDFHIDLGDTFMCEKHSEPLSPVVQICGDVPTVNARYIYERNNFGLVAHSAPLFLVNGNHEGELGFLVTGSGQDIATWATQARQRYFLNPTPDAFYSGDSVMEPNVGERAAWYSWQWGDALFVVLDPFWNTIKKSNSDGWVWTLGAKQYQWLTTTLSSSTAKYKFVFLHNLVGGLDGQMRGGVEAAPYYEWGGNNADDTQGFAQKRPGFAKPIHQLLVDNKVTAVFHGHDHLYAKQDLDGIVYQEVPQPSAKNTMSGPNLAMTYHYNSGTILSSAGHVRVTVAADHVTSEYVRSWLPSQENAQRQNGQIDDTYTMMAP